MLVAERYRLGSSLGRGGMGEVFRATDEQLGRTVAVKLMLPSERDPRAAERFRREARAAARLNDPHLVAVYDFGQHDEQFFLVMELVEGRTLADELAEHGPMTKDRAIDIAQQSAAGLAVAHAEDVVHRDVKPSNLLLTPDGVVKVADFGIAHLPGDGATTLTATGQIVGSTPYLAPERARGGRADKPSDVYALGCVLYQLVTGQPPFTGEHPTAILFQHVDTAPTPPSETRPELGGAFEVELLRMLAKDPAARPTAAEIAAGSLSAPLVGAAVAPTVAMTPALPQSQEPAVAAPASPPASPPDDRRRKILIAGGIAAVVAAAGVLTGVLINNNNNSNLPATNDVGPNPGAAPSTPSATPTDPPTTGPTATRSTSQPTRTTTQPSRTPSRPTQTPSTTPTTTPSATPTPTPSNTPTSNSPSPSSTPDDPPASSPPPETPPPGTQNLAN